MTKFQKYSRFFILKSKIFHYVIWGFANFFLEKSSSFRNFRFLTPNFSTTPYPIFKPRPGLKSVEHALSKGLYFWCLHFNFLAFWCVEMLKHFFAQNFLISIWNFRIFCFLLKNPMTIRSANLDNPRPNIQISYAWVYLDPSQCARNCATVTWS